MIPPLDMLDERGRAELEALTIRNPNLGGQTLDELIDAAVEEQCAALNRECARRASGADNDNTAEAGAA